MRREVFLFSLAVDEQQMDALLRTQPVIDDSHAARFALAGRSPSRLADAAAAANDRAGIGMRGEKFLQQTIFLVRQIARELRTSMA